MAEWARHGPCPAAGSFWNPRAMCYIRDLCTLDMTPRPCPGPLIFPFPVQPELPPATPRRICRQDGRRNFPLSDYRARFTPLGVGHKIVSSEAWIEYYLQAELRYNEVGKDHGHVFTCPITLRHPVTSFTEFGLQHKIIDRVIQGRHFLPIMEDGDASFAQTERKWKLFSWTGIPKLRYRVEIFAPATIRLENPTAIPYTLKFLQLDSTSDSIRNVPRATWLSSVTLTVRASTRVAGYSSTPSGDPRDSVHWKFYELGLEKICRKLDVFPLRIPLHEKGESFDIGTVLQLVLCSDGLRTGGRLLRKTDPIVPPFSFQGASRNNRLDVEFYLTVAGEEHRFSTSTPLTILAAD